MEVDIIEPGTTQVVTTLVDDLTLTSSSSSSSSSSAVISGGPSVGGVELGTTAVSSDIFQAVDGNLLLDGNVNNVFGDAEPSPTKKCTMDKDEDSVQRLSAEDKEKISTQMRQLSRKELEDLVLHKVVQAMVQNSETGKMRLKICQLQNQKHKLDQRIGHLQKQVAEMSRPLKVLVNNYNRDPNSLIPHKPTPPRMKFFRSVGLQVSIEPAARNNSSPSNHVRNNGKSSPSTDMTEVGRISGDLKKKSTIFRGSSSSKDGVRDDSPPLCPPIIVDLTDEDDPTESHGIHNSNHQMNPKTSSAVPESSGGTQPTNIANGPEVAATIKTATTTITTNRSPIISQQPLRPLQPAGIIIAKKSQPFTLPPLPEPPAKGVPAGLGVVNPADLPAKPLLTLNVDHEAGIVLSWTMNDFSPGSSTEIASYQLFTCQESLDSNTNKSAPVIRTTTGWKKVGDVKALPLPMACTLTKFAQGNRYYFIVRAVDSCGRCGPFCDPVPIVLQNKT